jgi:hypothetical protein
MAIRKKESSRLGYRYDYYGIYPAGPGGFLLVPSEDMRLVHEHAKPIAVRDRAGISLETWSAWKDHPPEFWLWLYQHGYQGQDPEPPAGITVDDEVLAFRRETSPGAIARAAIRDLRRRERTRQKLNAAVSKGAIGKWLRDFRNYPWFKGWLLRGEGPPPNVILATEGQVKRFWAAFDYATHCSNAGLNRVTTYVRWYGKQIPTVEWLLWVFGFNEPDGSLVMRPTLQQLRTEMTEDGICKAPPRISPTSLWNWRRNPDTKRAFGEILEAVKHHRSQADSESIRRLKPKTRRAMLTFAKKARDMACCARAGVAGSEYYRLVREERVKNYLTSQNPYGRTTHRDVGVITGNLCVPSAKMLMFREVTSKQRRAQRADDLLKLPGFEHWFLDWTRPHGKRPLGSQAANGYPENEKPARAPQKTEPSPGTHSATDGSAMMTPSALAEVFGLGLDLINKRLQRWRLKQENREGWIPVENPRPREAKFLYRLSAVRPILSSEASSEKK